MQEFLFNKVVGLRPSPFLLKKRVWHWRFPENFAKFLRAPPLAGSNHIYQRLRGGRGKSLSIYIDNFWHHSDIILVKMVYFIALALTKHAVNLSQFEMLLWIPLKKTTTPRLLYKIKMQIENKCLQSHSVSIILF